MAFKDKFPVEIEFEIDRKLLTRYYRIQSLTGCVLVTVPFGMIISVAFVQSFLTMHQEFTFVQRIATVACFGLAGILMGFFVALAFYISYFHKSSELNANNLRLRVEGPYLRLVTGGYFIIDRRYHFRDIHTYTTLQGPLLSRFGMKSLNFQVASMRQTPPVRVDGIIDVDSVRDQLCEIDAAREIT